MSKFEEFLYTSAAYFFEEEKEFQKKVKNRNVRLIF
jgi:hypothetical protein